ncbi:transcriptional regulator, LuxR family [Actinobacteria bacterium OK074]|nr:transcriptional regulator, LuxR family [Actinobacteria bacterium OK074]
MLAEPCRECDKANPIGPALALWRSSRFEESIELADSLAALKHSGCTGICAQLAQLGHAHLLFKVRKIPDAIRVLNGIEDPEDDLMALELRTESTIVHSEVDFGRGDIVIAMAKAEEALASGRGNVSRVQPVAHCILALGSLRRVDVRTGVHFANRLGGHALLGESDHMAGRCAWAVAQLYEADGGPGAAAHLIRGIVDNPALSHEVLTTEPAAAAWLVRVLRRLGDEERAEALAVETERVLMGRGGSPFLVHRASALHTTGVFEGDPVKLLHAVEIYPDIWAGASAREDLGELLLKRDSHRAEAIEQFEAAITRYTKCGSSRDVSRVTNKLWELGVRRLQTRVTNRNGSIDYGLTDAEFAIARLVSRGLTNREVGSQLFISRNTVAFHLRKVFRKMNISSRVELAAVWKNGVRQDG